MQPYPLEVHGLFSLSIWQIGIDLERLTFHNWLRLWPDSKSPVFQLGKVYYRML